MRHPSLTPALACLPVVLAGAAEAQTATPTPAFAHSVAATTAVAFTDRLDATASPRPFSGVGTTAGLRYRYEPGNWSVTAEAAGSRASYQPRDELAGSESAIAGGVALTVDRAVTSFHGTALRLGASVDTRAELLDHRYADRAATVSSFVSGFGTVGPTATLERSFAGGELAATGFLPLFGVAHQPYANVREEREGVSLRTVDFSQLRGQSVDLRYESSRNGRVGVVAEYRLKTFDYTAGWRTRSFTNSTAIGVVARFGNRSR